MTRAQTTAYRLRWLLLATAILCQAAGIFWLFSPYLYDSGIFGDFHPAGLTGTPFIFSPHWRDVLLYLGLFFLTQWLFLGCGKRWHIRLTTVARPLKRSIFSAAFIVTLLTFGVIATLAEIPNTWLPLLEWTGPAGFYTAMALVWAAWTAIFFIYWRQGDRYTQLGKMIRALIAGSVLELIVAAPVQAMTYHRDQCYCYRGSYTGLVLGFTVLLWTFGPGLVLVFMREKYRYERLQKTCINCGYDLTGSILADVTNCPQCGSQIPQSAQRQANNPAA